MKTLQNVIHYNFLPNFDIFNLRIYITKTQQHYRDLVHKLNFFLRVLLPRFLSDLNVSTGHGNIDLCPIKFALQRAQLSKNRTLAQYGLGVKESKLICF